LRNTNNVSLLGILFTFIPAFNPDLVTTLGILSFFLLNAALRVATSMLSRLILNLCSEINVGVIVTVGHIASEDF